MTNFLLESTMHENNIVNRSGIFIAYLIKNNINQKVYVGQSTRSLSERYKTGYKGCIKISRAMDLYDINNFYYEVIAAAFDQEDINKLENDLINQFDAIENGYNIRLGGSAVMTGRTHTKETKAKIGEASRNRSVTTKEKQKIAMLGSNNPQYGKKLSPEQLSKISGENSGHAILTNEDVIKIKILLSQNELTQEKIATLFNVSRDCISNINKGKNWKSIKVEGLNKSIKLSNKFVFKDEAEVCEKYLSGLTIEELSKLFGCSVTPIRSCLTRNNITIRTNDGKFVKGQNKHIRNLI